MSGHTPGPWKFIRGAFNDAPTPGAIGSIEGGDYWLAEIWSDYEATDDDPDGLPRGTAEANARLIAAAPDLLAALKDCVEFQGCGDPDCCDTARAQVVARQRAQDAIAKAEGK